VFEWVPRKAEANAAKHSVTFDDAVTVFLDPDALHGPTAALGGRIAIPSARTVRRRTGAHRGVYAQENWQCRNDPDHQRAAGEPPRARGVRVEELTFRMFQIRHRISWRPSAVWVGRRSGKNPVN
jgi:hypothetical protein